MAAMAMILHSDRSTYSKFPELKKKDPSKCYARKELLDTKEKIKTSDDLLLVCVKTVEKNGVDKTPKCTHSLGAVPKADSEIRSNTDCSMPLYKYVSNQCDDMIGEVQYKSVNNVLTMLNVHDSMAVIDIKSAYRALSMFLTIGHF